MKRYIRASISLPEDAARKLDRLRRGTSQPFARFAGRLLVEAIEAAAIAPRQPKQGIGRSS